MKYLKSMSWTLGLIATVQLGFALEVQNPANLPLKYCSGADCSFGQNTPGIDAISVSGGDPQPIKSTCVTITNSGQVLSCSNDAEPNTTSQQWQQNHEPEFRR